MTPRRLIPYVVIFLILVGTYAGLRWRQEQQVARDEQAKKVFHLKETDISDLSLVRGKDEVRLVKKDKVWRLTAPLDTKADQTIVDSMLTTLVRLRKERDLGEEKDLKPFGLDKPGLVVKFTAQGQPHQLVIGAKVPGDQNYYVLRDQDPHLLMISGGARIPWTANSWPSGTRPCWPLSPGRSRASGSRPPRRQWPWRRPVPRPGAGWDALTFGCGAIGWKNSCAISILPGPKNFWSLLPRS